MTEQETATVRDAAVALRDSIIADIPNAINRFETIRLTQLAAEAERLVQTIDILTATV